MVVHEHITMMYLSASFISRSLLTCARGSPMGLLVCCLHAMLSDTFT